MRPRVYIIVPMLPAASRAIADAMAIIAWALSPPPPVDSVGVAVGMGVCVGGTAVAVGSGVVVGVGV